MKIYIFKSTCVFILTVLASEGQSARIGPKERGEDLKTASAVGFMVLASGHLLGQVYTGEIRSGYSSTRLQDTNGSYGTVIVGLALSEGLVLAGDSRIVTTGSGGFYRVISDYTSKLFDMGRIGVAWYGQAFLQGRSLGGWLSDFQAKRPAGDVGKVASDISLYLAVPYDAQYPPVSANSSANPPSVRPILGLVIAGYDSMGVGKLLKIEFPNSPKPTEVFTTRRTGATWAGEIDVISRLILGYDERVRRLGILQALPKEQSLILDTQLSSLQYNIPFNALMMQDGIDFALSLVRITSEVQRFAHGTLGDASAIPGVGGSIDVLAITPFDLRWISHKRLDSR